MSTGREEPVPELLSADELEARRGAPGKSYEEHKAEAEARVVRRVWATGPAYSFQPYDAERGGWPRGRLLKEAPGDVAKKTELGFDADDELQLIREHTEFEGRCNEVFVDSADRQWVWRYQHRDQKKPHVVIQRVFDGDRLVGTALKSPFGFTRERYRWEGGFIREIEVELDTGDTNRFELVYTGGALTEVRVVSERAEPRVVFTAKPPDLKALLTALTDRLPRVVARTIAAAKETRPVFCLMLSYSDESPEEMALPALSLGLDADRERWRASGAAPTALWNPASFSSHDSDALELHDEELDHVARALATALRAPKDYAAVKKAYLAAATALMTRDWASILAPTSDFKVMAVNVDMSDLAKNLAAIHGKEVAKELKRVGLL